MTIPATTPKASTPADPGPSDAVPRSVGRVLDAFETVLAEGTCNLATVARATALTPTTALRHLRALEARGYLVRDEAGAFSAGPTVLRIAASLHDDGPLERLVAVVQPHLDRLAAETGESAYLAVGDGSTATYVAVAEGTRRGRHVGWVGQDVPTDGSAVGEALAEPGTIRVRSGAVEPDVTAVSVGFPSTGPAGMRCALSVIGPSARVAGAHLDHVGEGVVLAADQVSSQLGTSREETSDTEERVA